MDIPMDGRLKARQAGNRNVENDFPLWEMVSHRWEWFPAVGYHFLHFSQLFGPYILNPIRIFDFPDIVVVDTRLSGYTNFSGHARYTYVPVVGVQFVGTLRFNPTNIHAA